MRACLWKEKEEKEKTPTQCVMREETKGKEDRRGRSAVQSALDLAHSLTRFRRRTMPCHATQRNATQCYAEES
jgi:hypothetical protein